MSALLLALLLAQEETVILRVVESPPASTFPEIELAPGETGVCVAGGNRELLAAAGFSVLNVGWSDVGSAGLSANVKGADRAFVLREIGGRQVAFVGVAAPPAGKAVDGVADPKAALAKALAEAKADLVVGVAHLSRAQAAELFRGTPVALVVVSGRGGGDAEPLKLGDTWFVQAPGPGSAWARVGVAVDGAGKIASVSCRYTRPEGKPSSVVADAKRRLGAEDPVEALRATTKPAGPAPAPLEASNRASRVVIHGVAERPAYGARNTLRPLLVVDVEIENTIPLTLVKQNQVPTQYRIPNLADHLYLVLDGVRVSRLLKDADELPGHLPVKGFQLDRLGSRLRGNLVFEVGPAASLELRFYDYAHGHWTLPLRGKPPEPAKPVQPLQSNDVVEAGVFAWSRAKERKGMAAPEGTTWIVAEFRARSMLFTEGDATAFDPKAAPKSKLKIGTVSDWKDSTRHLTLVADGERAFDSPETPEAPRFLPDLFTGFEVAFLAPEKASSVELRADFPNALLPDGRTVRPKPLVFLLEGEKPAPPKRVPFVTIDDPPFQVIVHGQSVEKDLLSLEMAVRNGGTLTETFQTEEQLKYVTEKGQQQALHEATWSGPSRPGKLHLVPPGEWRSFRAVFRISPGELQPRLAYRGVTKAEIVPLQRLGAALPQTAAACPKCKAKVDVAEKFCGECGTKLK
jgi:hypothetical protein